MNRQEADGIISFLEMKFAKDYPEPSRSNLLSELLSHGNDAGGRAVDRLLIEERFLPTPVVIMRAVMEQSSYLRERQAEKERRQNQSRDFFANQPHDSEHAKLACKLVRGIIAGFDRDRILAGMEKMAQRFPEAGWSVEAAKLKEFYAQIDRGREKAGIA